MRRSCVARSLTGVIAAAAIAGLLASPVHACAGDQARIPGPRAAASVVRDTDGVGDCELGARVLAGAIRRLAS